MADLGGGIDDGEIHVTPCPASDQERQPLQTRDVARGFQRVGAVRMRKQEK